MNRSLALLSSAALLAAAANAQGCYVSTGTSIVPSLVATSTYPVDDEGEAEIAFNAFTFPMGGTNWTHYVVNSNGEVYLTDGTGVVNRAVFGVSALAEMRGGVGGSPRIMALGGDCQGVAGLATWDIKVDDTIPGEVTICYEGMRPFAGTGYDWNCSIRLTSAGDITLSYGLTGFGAQNTGDYAGVSEGNDVGTGSEASSDLNFTGDSGSLGLIYQNNWAASGGFDLQDQSVLFVPNGTGGYTYVVSCGTPPNPPAAHNSYGEGCYDNSTFGSVYQEFSNSAAASATLTALPSLQYIPNGTGGMLLVPGAGTFQPTTNATPMTHTDDSFDVFTPSVPFNHLNTTPIADLYVCSNGFVNLGASNPSTFSLLNTGGFSTSANPGFAAYGEDLNPASSGTYLVEEVGGIVYITADAVVHFGNTDPQTFQYQFDLATGIVTVVYQTVGTLDADNVIIGYTPGNPAGLDMGGIDVLTDLPYDATTDSVSPAMSMTAGPAPISLPGSGTTVNYDVFDIPEFLPGSATAVGILVLSAGSNPGTDLGFLGAPGCNLYVASLDATIAFVAPGANAATVMFDVPAGVPATTSIFAQAAALSQAANTFGVVTSNGIEAFISDN